MFFVLGESFCYDESAITLPPVMIKFFTRKKVRKTGCISVGYIVCAHVGHYVKEVKSDV